MFLIEIICENEKDQVRTWTYDLSLPTESLYQLTLPPLGSYFAFQIISMDF